MKSHRVESNYNQFSLNKDAYENHLKYVYEVHNELKPQFLFEFPILLPFQLAFVEGSTSTFIMEEGKACTFRFTHLVVENIASFVGKKTITLPTKRTIVQMIYALNDEVQFPPDNRLLTTIFDELLMFLNRQISAYLVFTKEVDVYQVTKEMLEHTSLVRIVPLNDWDSEWIGLFIKNKNIHHIKEDLKQETHSQILWYSHVIEQNLNPFISAENIMLNASRNLKSGFFKEAVIFSQMSIEVFLSILYSQFLGVEGMSEPDVQAMLESTPFIPMVKNEFSKRIGGSWNLEKEGTSVGNWYSNSYKLRNRVAHAGYMPSLDETSLCFDSAIDLRKFVVKQLKKQPKKYNDIFKYFEKT